MRTPAKLNRSLSVVADRSGGALRLRADGWPRPDSLAVRTTGAVAPQGDGEDRGRSEPVSSAVTGSAHGSSRAPANSVEIPQGDPSDATQQDLIGAERVLIVDDCTLFRENLAAALAVNGIAVAGTAWDLPSLVTTFEAADVDLVLISVETRDSHLLLRAVTDMSPGAPVIAVGISEQDEQKIIACAEAGVAGYHMRGDSLRDLITLIHNVAAGRSFCPPPVATILLRRLSNLAAQPQQAGRDLALTPREAQILKMLELGRSNSEIAARLDIAVHTVKNHVHNLLTKLGVNTRAEAAGLSRTIRFERGVSKN
jgi:DNA-binding NarL/FixJ family response regulator